MAEPRLKPWSMTVPGWRKRLAQRATYALHQTRAFRLFIREKPDFSANKSLALPVLGVRRCAMQLAERGTVGTISIQFAPQNQNERTAMFRHFRSLGIAGLTTLSASQLALAGPNSVLWSHNQDNSAVIVSGIKTAARAISRLNPQHTLVRFNHHKAGGVALVPLLAYGAPDERCSPDFEVAPFQAVKGGELWASFEFVNVAESDMDLLAFGIKADKPGRKDRFRVDHDIGRSHVGNKPSMSAMIAPPAEGDQGYYFLDRGILRTDELLCRNPGAAIKITISNHARGPAA